MQSRLALRILLPALAGILLAAAALAVGVVDHVHVERRAGEKQGRAHLAGEIVGVGAQKDN